MTGRMDPPLDEFPQPIPDDANDPLGVEVATRIAREVAGILPPPRGVAPRRRRRRSEVGEQRSGPGPDPRDPQPLGDVLKRVVSNRGWDTELGLRQLLVNWTALVGSTIAEHSEPVGFTERVLVVQAESTSWATALRHMAPQLLARLNDDLGQGSIERIDVRGPAAPSWKHGIRSVRDGRGPRDTYG